jgi:endonuclease/exonuclease/phosphatase family metal-dependent hydrolase
MAPIGVEEDVTVERETFEARLEIAISQFKEFGPHLVGVSEAAWVEGLGESAWGRLIAGLQMEGILLARANPWNLGMSQEESDELVKVVGFEEGEYLLSRFPILSAKRYDLPSPSVFESRAVLHAVVDAPQPLGKIDVYVTRFGGDERRLALQAQSLLSTIARTHDPARGIIVMGDLGAAPDSDVLKVLVDAGYLDPLAGNAEAVTCCRQAVLFDAADLTPTPTATVDPSQTPDPDSTPELPPGPGPAEVAIRTDYILVRQWNAEDWRLIGHLPVEQSNGQGLFASDHNGIGIVFDVAPRETANR